MRSGIEKENRGGMSEGAATTEEIQRSMKLVETIGVQKKVVEQENGELRNRVDAL
jgi:hypothetical protein